jgi:hypothetical protein
MSTEIDKLLAEAIGKGKECLAQTRREWDMCCEECDLCEDFYDYPAYSTSDYAAQDWLKAAARVGVSIRVMTVDKFARLNLEQERYKGLDYTGDGNGGNALAAALVDAVVEEYCTGCKSADCLPRPKELMAYRIKPAIAAILKGDGRE